MDVRDGRPGVFLRVLRVPAERRHDEPVLHLRRLPEVSPLLRGAFSCQTPTGIREERVNFLCGPFHPSAVSCQAWKEKQLYGFSLLSNLDVKHQIEDDLSETVLCSLTL